MHSPFQVWMWPRPRWLDRSDNQPRSARRRRAIAVAALGALLLSFNAACSAAAPPGPVAEPSLRVLFVGNSLTYYNDLPGMVRQIAAAGSRRVEARVEAFGDATLEAHWVQGDVPDIIRDEPWDYVVLQEHNDYPIESRELFFRYARLFDDVIRDSGAKTVLFLPWAHQDEPAQQAVLTAAYERIGIELGAKVAPVGRAWQAVRDEAGTDDLFDDDGIHPNPTGSYLAACVLHATLQLMDPAGSGPTLRDPETGAVLISLDAGIAARLQSIAWRTVSRRPPHVLQVDAVANLTR